MGSQGRQSPSGNTSGNLAWSRRISPGIGQLYRLQGWLHPDGLARRLRARHGEATPGRLITYLPEPAFVAAALGLLLGLHDNVALSTHGLLLGNSTLFDARFGVRQVAVPIWVAAEGSTPGEMALEGIGTGEGVIAENAHVRPVTGVYKRLSSHAP